MIGREIGGLEVEEDAVDLKPGVRLKSVVDDTEVIVVRSPSGPVDLCCGGHPMAARTEDTPQGLSIDIGHDTGTQMGKRYTDEASGLELLCTKAGKGSLSLGPTPLLLKDAKPLPSSD